MTSSVITFDKITAKRTLAGRVNLAREVFLRRGEAFDPAQIVAGTGNAPVREAQRQRLVVRRNEECTPRRKLPTAIEAAFAQGDEIPDRGGVSRAAKWAAACSSPAAGGMFSRSRRSFRRRISSTTKPSTPPDFPTKSPPADITPEVKAELNRMTREAYRTCRCSGRRKGRLHRHPRGRAPISSS